jgi:hypothetical protein
MPPQPTRRTVVTAVVALPAAAAAGCSLGAPDGSRQATSGRGGADPDVALLDRVAGGTERMVALYEATMERHRDLRGDLRGLLAAHRAHAAALGEAAPPARGTGGPGAGSRQPATPRPDVAGRPGAAVRELRAAERDASDELQAAAARADSGPFARLLASMAAASAQHARVLAEVDA